MFQSGDHDADLLIGLEGVDDLLEPLDHLRAHDVDRRVVDRDTPIGRRSPGQSDLCSVCSGFHRGLLSPKYAYAEPAPGRQYTMVSSILWYQLDDFVQPQRSHIITGLAGIVSDSVFEHQSIDDNLV
jgi:hypothetical protein